jgi:hypothetical protein
MHPLYSTIYLSLQHCLTHLLYMTCTHAQTETPEQLKQRNSARKPGQRAASVVERQAVAVLSRGTLMDPEMVAGHPDAAYVLAGGRVRLHVPACTGRLGQQRAGVDFREICWKAVATVGRHSWGDVGAETW